MAIENLRGGVFFLLIKKEKLYCHENQRYDEQGINPAVADLDAHTIYKFGDVRVSVITPAGKRIPPQLLHQGGERTDDIKLMEHKGPPEKLDNHERNNVPEMEGNPFRPDAEGNGKEPEPK